MSEWDEEVDDITLNILERRENREFLKKRKIIASKTRLKLNVKRARKKQSKTR